MVLSISGMQAHIICLAKSTCLLAVRHAAPHGSPALLQLAAGNNSKHASGSRHLLHASVQSHQSQKSVSYEDKVCLVSFLIPQYCVHAPYLVVGRNQL